MSRGLSGLGLIAILAPTVGGLIAAWLGWRGALGLVSALGAGMGLFIALKVPETARALNPQALALRPLLANFSAVMANASFRAWASLVTFTYAGLFVLLAGSSFVYTGPLGLPAWGYGLAMASASMAYLIGTFLCRRWLPRLGLAGTVRIGGAFTLAGGSLMLLLGLADVRHAAPVLLAHWLYSFGHGIHQPCGQSGAVGPFPRMAGTASALAGFMLALTAFGVGLWMGQAMDGSLKMLSIGVFVAAVATTTVAWTLVQRDGDRLAQRPA
jgi:DHA1 family bicyclomycin/chloramphenicol resistance-like MFS transporter